MVLLGGGPHHADLTIKAQPRASRSEIAGLHGDALRVRLAAPPVEGAANRELEKLIAKVLDLPRSSVEVIRGMSGREKVLRIHGLSPEEVRERLGI